MKFVLCLCIFVLLIFWFVVCIFVSIVGGVVYGFFLLIFVIFDVVGEGKTDKFFYCIYVCNLIVLIDLINFEKEKGFKIKII